MQLRRANISRLKNQHYDVLVIGAGINGAVSAAALADQGAKVAIIDQRDFACMTSQESSNLVWGGIKYMESWEFPLVRKLCNSRNKLIKNFPSQVKEIRFFTLCPKKFRHARLTLYLGAWLYWFIGNGFTRKPRLLSKQDISHKEPAIHLEGFKGGFEYSDAYLIDCDARFVFQFILSAMCAGANVTNYIKSSGSKWDGENWQTTVQNTISQESFTITSKSIINACGPYVDLHNQNCQQQTSHQHIFSKGIHLIVNRITEHKRVLTFFADDGRLFFVIPLGDKSCIGTTDTHVEKPDVAVSDEDRRFVLENINKRLKLVAKLTESDIISERCGVRPLVTEKGNSQGGDWFSLSRKHVVEVNKHNNYVSIFGGKLTDCLNVGEEVVQAVKSFKVELNQYGKKWFGEPPSEAYREFRRRARYMKLGENVSIERIWRYYNWQAFKILDDIQRDRKMGQVLLGEYLRGEIYHMAQTEMITKLEDFLRRRTTIALVHRKNDLRENTDTKEICEILFAKEAEEKWQEYFK